MPPPSFQAAVTALRLVSGSSLLSGSSGDFSPRADSRSALWSAVCRGPIDKIQRLLQSGEEPDVPGLVHLAADRGNLLVLELLLRVGCDANGSSFDRGSYVSRRDSMVQAAPSPMPEATAVAPGRGEHVLAAETVDAATSKGLGQLDKMVFNPQQPVHPLHVAVAAGNCQVVRWLCDERQSALVDIESRTQGFDDTPLITAALLGQHQCVKAMVAAGASVNARGNGGQTAVFAAAMCGHVAIVDYLLRNGADVAAADGFGSHEPGQCEDPSQLAVIVANAIRTRLFALQTSTIFDNASVGVSAAAKRIGTSSTAKQGMVLCHRLLIAAGCPLKINMWHSSYYGSMSHLRAAIAYADVTAVKALVRLGNDRVDTNEVDHNSNTPLQIVAARIAAATIQSLNSIRSPLSSSLSASSPADTQPASPAGSLTLPHPSSVMPAGSTPRVSTGVAGVPPCLPDRSCHRDGRCDWAAMGSALVDAGCPPWAACAVLGLGVCDPTNSSVMQEWRDVRLATQLLSLDGDGDSDDDDHRARQTSGTHDMRTGILQHQTPEQKAAAEEARYVILVRQSARLLELAHIEARKILITARRDEELTAGAALQPLSLNRPATYRWDTHNNIVKDHPAAVIAAAEYLRGIASAWMRCWTWQRRSPLIAHAAWVNNELVTGGAR